MCVSPITFRSDLEKCVILSHLVHRGVYMRNVCLPMYEYVCIYVGLPLYEHLYICTYVYVCMSKYTYVYVCVRMYNLFV